MNDSFYNPNKKNTDCPCCHGTGVQRNQKTGLVQECPCCFRNRIRKNLLKRPRIFISKEYI